LPSAPWERLRHLGFSLDEVRECLDRADFSTLELIERHATRLRDQIAHQRSLCERLESLAALKAVGG